MARLSSVQTRRTFLNRATATAIACASARLTSSAQAVNLGRRVFDAKKFGAIGDGFANDTAALQRAIDAAAQAGAGTVQFAPGRYVTGTLLLKSGVTLELQAGATLLGSLNPSDYKLVEPFIDGTGQVRGYALLACVDVQDVHIGGPGAIDGRGAEVHAAAPNEPAAKPFLVLCVRSSRIAIRDVKLVNSAAWTMHLFQSSNIAVDSVSIRSLGLANNDGIDIDSSQHIRVTGCTIETGDDAICLKTTSPKPCQDITVKHCTLTTRCAAFKIGTESAGDFSSIRVSDCHIIQANLGAIKLLSVDGAHISGVAVERITVDDADTPIFLRLGARGRTFRAGNTALPPGSISDITIRDVAVQRAHRIGILISGIPGHSIEDITFQNISIAMAGDPVTLVPAPPAENPAAYPEIRMFGANLPASCLYARHIQKLTATNLKIVPISGDLRPKRLILD
jgi:polygalacturonase